MRQLPYYSHCPESGMLLSNVAGMACDTIGLYLPLFSRASLISTVAFPLSIVLTALLVYVYLPLSVCAWRGFMWT